METGKGNQRADSIFYASPLIFLAACGLLVLIIGVFAVNNYQREKRLNELVLKQEATAILNLVAAGSRRELRRGFMRGELDEENWIDFFFQTIENSAEHPGLLGLYLVDQNGAVRTHSDTQQIGGRVDEQTLLLLRDQKETRQRTISAIVKQPGNSEPVFLMAMTFLPAAAMDGPLPLNRGRMERGRHESSGLPEHLERMRAVAAAPLTLVVELSLDGYQQAIKKQILQIAILSLVLLLVGGGGLLSLALIQNYKGSQKRLKSIHSFTDTLVASLPLGLIATTEEGRIRTCNPSAAQMLNLEADACLGLELTEVLDPKVLEDLKLHQQEEIHRWEMETSINTGMERSLFFTRVKIDNEDERAGGLMLLVQDLSLIRQLENQLQRAEQEAIVGRMAAGVAHELRNPLSSVKGLTLLLKSRFKDDLSTQQTADLMVEQVERLDRSISELLDYARPGLTTKTTLQVDELLAKAVMLVRTDTETQHITVEENFGCGAATMEGDKDKLTQVFLNLFLNGIQAMEEGGRLIVSTFCSEDEIIVEIGDSGRGIPPDLVEKVFEPYFTTKQDGTGLGLAMSTKIIHDHSGRMTLESHENQGTTVTVRLPVH
ncbi:MAG: PAS domain-containing protein [Desulfofustis sp.]|nr:PAS domain-containing protein [Desulfofustis sp.]